MPNAMDKVPVYYRPEMVADVESFSPSAGKPRLVVEDWLERGLPIEVRTFEPATEAELSMAHAPGYVRGVLAGEVRNGFGSKSLEVARSLPYTSGAMLAAAREALRNGVVAVAPVSGFHHAQFDHAAGFCTFNGLVLTAMVLKAAGQVERVGILDLDEHFGDGTEALIRRHRLDYVVHFTAGAEYHEPEQAEAFLQRLPSIVERFRGCDVVLYQAGADPHVDDPLGGWLTTEQLGRRDAIVFAECAARPVPVAWNLAGGYQRDAAGTVEPVLAIHRQTVRAAVACSRGSWTRIDSPR
jgi:acetoin utilization deacetylase AcuC-like enzyme